MHLQTFTGRQFAPLAPKASDIEIEDIAHALSHLCRFGGHVREFYSVAQHAVLVSRAVPVEFALWGLLHDASEAYLVDIPTPVKRTALLVGYRGIEAMLQRTIYQRFGLVGDEPEAVHAADQGVLLLEADALLQGGPGPEFDKLRGQVPVPELRVVPVAAPVAKRAFLKRFSELTEAPRG